MKPAAKVEVRVELRIIQPNGASLTETSSAHVTDGEARVFARTIRGWMARIGGGRA